MTEDKLKKAMDKKDEDNLRKVIKEIDPKPRMINNFKTWAGDLDQHEDTYVKIHVDEKLLNEAHILLEKLRTSNILNRDLNNLVIIEDYKRIMKARDQIDLRLDDALKRGVRLDQEVKESARATKDRIIAERNLRFRYLDLYKVNGAKTSEVEDLNEYI